MDKPETPRKKGPKPAGAPASRAPKKPASKVDAPGEEGAGSAPASVFPVDLTGGVDEALRRLAREAKHWVNKGRYTKLRFKFRGKQLLPDLPVGAVLAAEAATFYWTGILKAIVFNLVGRSVLDVETINEADLEVAKGREHLLAGDLPEAAEALTTALQMDRENAAGWLNLGVVKKLQGKRKTATRHFRRAHELAPASEAGREAARQLASLGIVVEEQEP